MASTTISNHVNVRQCSQCQGDAKYYCHTCRENLCPSCKIHHLINLDTKQHNITLYKYKYKECIDNEICARHPGKVYTLYCATCDIPACVYCKEHRQHKLQRLTTAYKRKKEQLNESITQIRCETLYIRQNLLAKIESDDVRTYQNKIDKYQSAVKSRSKRVKDILDTMKLRKQIVIMKLLISEMEKDEKRLFMVAKKPVQYLRFIKRPRFPQIQYTPNLIWAWPFSFSVKFEIEGVKNLLSKVQEKGKRRAGIELLLKLMNSPVLQKTYKVKDIENCEHISIVTKDMVCVNDKNKLVIIETTIGKVVYSASDFSNISWSGIHTMTTSFDLIYIATDQSIKQISNEGVTTTIWRKTDLEWKPQCVYCCPSNGDILISMHRVDRKKCKEKGSVIRLKNTGQVMQTIPHENTCLGLYIDPRYIIENNNGDIVVSDYWRGVVVTDYGGNYRFTYRANPSGQKIAPRGICTDALSHILVCDRKSESVHILDEDGNFLLFLLTTQSPGLDIKPCSLSYDVHTHLLWVGSYNNTLSVYRHLNGHFAQTDNLGMLTDDRLVSTINIPSKSQEETAIATVDPDGTTEKTQTSDIANVDATLTADKTKEEAAMKFWVEKMDAVGKKIKDISADTFLDEYKQLTNPTQEQAINIGQDLLKFVVKELLETTEEAFSDAAEKGLPLARRGITRMDVADIMADIEDFSLNFSSLVANAKEGVQQTKNVSTETVIESFMHQDMEKDLNITNLRKLATNFKDIFLTLFSSSEINKMLLENKNENKNFNENKDDIRSNEEEGSDKGQILYKR